MPALVLLVAAGPYCPPWLAAATAGWAAALAFRLLQLWVFLPCFCVFRPLLCGLVSVRAASAALVWHVITLD